MSSLLNLINRNAKSVLLLAVILLAMGAEALGFDVGLDIQQYIGLLLVNLGVWGIPNRDTE